MECDNAGLPTLSGVRYRDAGQSVIETTRASLKRPHEGLITTAAWKLHSMVSDSWPPM